MASLSFIDEKTKKVLFVDKSKVFDYDEDWELPKEIAISFKNYIDNGKK